VEFALFGVFSGSQLAWIRSSLVNYVSNIYIRNTKKKSTFRDFF
jgi:hypothetical protein